MSSVLYDRRCRLTIATPVDVPGDYKNVTTVVTEVDGGRSGQGSGLRVAFDITKTLKKEPNDCKITVTNLSPNHRKQMQKKGSRVKLEAGYAGSDLFLVFSGDVRTVSHVNNGADWDTEIGLGDGERAWQFARVQESFAEGTTLGDAIKTAVKRLGIDEGNLSSVMGSLRQKLDAGYAVSGSAARAVDDLVRMAGMTWSVQDGKFQILTKTGSVSGQIPDISADTGLIGSPEFGTPDKKTKVSLLKFKSLLIPMTPGKRVRLSCVRYKGEVVVKACKFSGDTHGGDWYTEMTGEIKGE